MQSIILNLSSAHSERLVDAICGLQDYDSETRSSLESGETVETPENFTKRKIREWLVSQVRRWEQAEAQRMTAGTVTDIEMQ